MAELSKQALKVENNTEFPNNNAGLITPSKLRGFNVDMIDSLVDEISYQIDSASWNSSIDNINAFTASAQSLTTGSLLVTASAAQNVITFTKGDGSTFNVTVADTTDLSPLNQATQSLQAFTQSANIRLTNLEAATASLNTSVSNINLFTQSAGVSITNLNQSSASQQAEINSLIAGTGSYATTGSNIFTGANTFTSISASSFVSASAFVGDGSKITNITASISMPILNDGVPQGNANSLNFTGSAINASVVANIGIISVNAVDSASFNAYTASNDQKVNSLIAATASYADSASVAAVDAAQQAQINSLIAATSSYVTDSDTGSFARYDVSNPWSADQVFTNISAVSASFTYVQTIYETASVIYSSGSNQLGDELTDTQTLSGSVKVQGSLTINGVPVQTSSFDPSALNQATASLQAFTQSANLRLNSLEAATSSYAISSSVAAVDAAQQSQINALINATASYAISSSVAAVDAAQQAQINSLIAATASYADSASFAASQLVQDNRLGSLEAATSSYAISSSVAAVDAAQQAQINSLIAATASFVTEAESGSFLITASFDNGTRNLTFTKGDASTFNVNIPDVSGSAGDFVTTSSFNAYTQSNDQRVTSLEANSASVNTSISNLNTATASLFTSASLGLTTASVSLNTITFSKGDGTTFQLNVDTGSGQPVPAGTISGSAQITALGFVSSSITASSLITASVAGADITFTKGDGSTFVITTATGSVASASYAETASLAINALTASIARNLIVIARNGGSSTLPAGTVVHITSAVGDNPIFTTASYDTEALSSNTFGLLRYSSAAGADVEVVVAGVVTGVDTDPALGYTAGDIVYLSSSGQFTRVQPQAPNQIVTLGQVLRAQQNNGSIYVSINNGWELNELHNVQINSPQTGDLLQYESASYGLWKNKTISGAGITSTSSFNAYTQSTDSRLTNIEATTASLNTSVSNLNTFSSSTLVSLSNLNTTTASLLVETSNLEIFSASALISLSNLNTATASLFTSASLALTTGSVNGNVLTFTKGDASTFSLTVATGSGGGGGVSFPYSGSVEITGSVKVKPFTLSVTSNTASIDMNESNYFILYLPTGSATRINFSNIVAGESVNLLVSQSASATTGSVTFGSNVYWPGGLDYQATATGSARDVVSFLAFTTAEVMATQIKNLY